MPRFKGQLVDGKAAADWKAVYAACAKYERFIVEVRRYDPQREITRRQTAWWKGILLPALVEDTGDSTESLETKLKLSVMPDEFKPQTVVVNNISFSYVPSITKLSVKQMNQLIEGAVAKLHEWGFGWVTLPDSSLRS